MKVFVTGGTGFLGYHLVKECVRKNFNVTCLVRKETLHSKKEICSEYKRNGIEFSLGDVTDANNLASIFEKNYYDLVFYLVGIYTTKQQTLKVNVGGVKNILNVLLKNRALPKRFVFMSSTGAIGPIKSNKPLDEKTECKPENVYEKSKLESENFIKKFSMINYAIVRSPRIYGPMDPQNTFSSFVKFAKIGVLPVIDNFPISLVYVKNVVQGLMLAATKSKAIKNTYIISDRKTYESMEIANLIANALQVKRKVLVKIPRAAFQTISFFNDAYRYALNNVHYSIKKAEEELDYKPKYELKDAISEMF